MDIERMLRSAGRNWVGQRGALEADIARLVNASPHCLPEILLDLLRLSNGGEGSLALAPQWFVLKNVCEIIASIGDEFLRQAFPGFLFFGGNGGLESIAFECRNGVEPWPIVMIDLIAGPESAERIAANVEVFVQAIGLEYDGNYHAN
jgi:hypothetical protein